MAGTPEQYKSLIDTLTNLNIVPKADTKEDFESWMKAYMEEHGLVGTLKVDSGPPVHPVKSETTEHHEKLAYIHPPRLSVFSGTSGKGETSFDLWFYEVKCLLQEKTHTRELIAQIGRASCRERV